MSDSVGMLKQLQAKFNVAKDESVSGQISSKIEELEDEIPARLIQDNPFAEHRAALKSAEESYQNGVSDLPSIKSDAAAFGKLADFTQTRREKFYADRLNELSQKDAELNLHLDAEKKLAKLGNVKKTADKKIEKLARDKKTFRGLLQKNWRELLDKEYARWEINKIAEYRRALMEKLEEWLKLLQQLADALNDLWIDPGLLFDLSKGNLSPSDIEQVKQWAKYLSENESVRELCEMLGRMRVAAAAKRTEIIRTTEIVPETRVDINSKEEISGVEAGDSLEHVLPQEKALLADEDTADLFYLKFAEKRLMQFVMTGKQTVDVRLEKEEERQVEEKEKMGPIIVCVDTSGSMQGTPETVAKAVALYMATSAMNQNRDCFLINFSSEVETRDLSGQTGFAELIGFLKMSFNRGTDFAPAVKCALEKMREEKYQNADLLVVSDFIMAEELPSGLHPEIAEVKKNGNKFHSLTVGDKFLRAKLKDVFDNEWVFNPQTGGVRSLLDFADAAGGQKYL